MANNELSNENKIFEVANKIFLLYGYHGTTLQQIATKAGVNKSAIHYYFRSKGNIYAIVLRKNLTLLLNTLNNSGYYSISKSNEPFSEGAIQNIETEMIVWFLINEIRTNNQFIREMIRTDDKISSLITSIFSYPENIEILESLITSQFFKIINNDLLAKIDPIEQALK
jgi:AcrR family transcriptional regulator